MDRKTAEILLESLVDRIEQDPEGGKWRLTGPISRQEKEALHVALSQLRSDQVSEGFVTDRESSTPVAKVLLDLESSKLEKPEDLDVTLCLDFGTAMSKAFAIRSPAEKPLELAVGKRASAEGSVFAVPSSLFITSSGRMYFGQSAINQSLQDDTLGRRRFDSPKQELSQGTMADLGESAVAQDINPTSVPLSKKDLITMYLAFLTDLSSTELKERHGVSRYVLRRFARPCWNEERTAWAEQVLKEMLAAAQILADTFHNRFGEGIYVAEARQALDQLKGRTLPSCLISNGVAEPIAAAASRVIQGKAQRRPYMIIDVGAGTTDFGLFVVSEDPKKERAWATQVGNAIEGVRQAGDTIDSILRGEILSRHGLLRRVDDSIRKRIITDLDLRIRIHKETLFRRGKLDYTLSDDSRGTISLEEFLALETTKRFSDSLEDAFQRILDRVGINWIKLVLGPQGLTVVLTGGGARLPMVQRLTENSIRTRGIGILRSRAPGLPRWIEDDHPEFADEYPQLAVAMGGASAGLPEMMKPVMEFGGQPTPTVVSGNLQISGT